MVKRLKKKSMIPVLSAFGGCAIYKMPKIKNCWYDAQNRDKSTSRIYYIEDCEHVSFHRQMKERNNAQIFISSSILFPSSPPSQHPQSQHRKLKTLLFSHKWEKAFFECRIGIEYILPLYHFIKATKTHKYINKWIMQILGRFLK